MGCGQTAGQDMQPEAPQKLLRRQGLISFRGAIAKYSRPSRAVVTAARSAAGLEKAIPDGTHNVGHLQGWPVIFSAASGNVSHGPDWKPRAFFREVGSWRPPFSVTQLISNLSSPPYLLTSEHAVESAATAASSKSLFHSSAPRQNSFPWLTCATPVSVG